jgi:hypothetical protein
MEETRERSQASPSPSQPSQSESAELAAAKERIRQLETARAEFVDVVRTIDSNLAVAVRDLNASATRVSRDVALREGAIRKVNLQLGGQIARLSALFD